MGCMIKREGIYRFSSNCCQKMSKDHIGCTESIVSPCNSFIAPCRNRPENSCEFQFVFHRRSRISHKA